MSLFENGSDNPINFKELTPPWDDSRPSIYEHIKEHLVDGRLIEDRPDLPDDDLIYDGSEIKWVPGGQDGAFGHHSSPADTRKFTSRLIKALKNVLKNGNSKTLSAFYDLLLDENTLSFIDDFIDQLLEQELINDPSLYALAKWIVKNSPDREAVKACLAILGICATSDDSEIFIDMGKHEEFTLFAVVAISGVLEDPEEAIFEMAKSVEGWGRIHIIERLAETDNDEIRDWMLKEGYKNSIMYEYTAHICATAGDLLTALSCSDPDDQLLEGACSIIQHLGSPGPPIEEYEEAPEAILMLLEHLDRKEISLSQLVSVNIIESIFQEREFNTEGDEIWLEVEESVLDLCTRIKARPRWQEIIENSLDPEDRNLFYSATEAARYLGIDIWDRLFELAKEGKADWYLLFQTRDFERAKQAIDLAEKTLPLDSIATGVDDSLGLGSAFKNHLDLDFILQELGSWPGSGLILIETALKSPVTRNRFMAVRALSDWGVDFLNEDIENKLKELLKVEPKEELREKIEELLLKRSMS